MNPKTTYLPGLNGLRGILAIAVAISHITIALHKFNIDTPFSNNQTKWYLLGEYQVSIFLVLSGFLITYLLQKEKAQYNRIDIKKFYVRRILRIWPLYYLYLIIAVLVTLSLNSVIYGKALAMYIFFAANIPVVIGPRIPLLTHYWSLGAEEQFYFFWPWLYNKMTSLLKFALGLIVCIIAAKIVLHKFYPGSLIEAFIAVTKFHCIMIGAVGAILYKQENNLFLKLIDNKITQLLSWVILVHVAFYQYRFIPLIDTEIISVIGLFIIIGQIRIRNRIINMENRVLNFLGKISYGIYIFHPLIIILFTKLLNGLTIHYTIKFLIVYVSIIGAVILLAYLSFTYFEKYFLQLKKKFQVVKNSPYL